MGIYIQSCSEIATGNDEGDWEGKIHAFQNKIKKLEITTKRNKKKIISSTKEEFKKMSSENDNLSKKLDGLLKDVEIIKNSKNFEKIIS